MALPSKSVAWTYSLNNRLSYTSLVQVSRDLMYLVKQALVTGGYTVKGSSNGAAGAMDGVDRWASATDAGTRGATTTTPCSWFVLTDGNGADVLLAFVSASDDVFRVSVSHAGDYAVAATATHQPTSANEQILGPGFFTTVVPSMIGATASADRVAHIWVAPSALGFRVAVYRSAVFVSAWGVEEHTPATYAPGVTCSAGFGFFINGAVASSNLFYDTAVTSASSQQFRVAVRTSQGARLATCAKSIEAVATGGISTDFGGVLGTFAPEMQGTDYLLRRMGIFSTLTASRGKIGAFKDWWIGRSGTGVADGDTYGNREFICIDSEGIVWPWNGTPTVVGSAVSIA